MTDDATMLGHVVHRLFEQAADKYAEKTALACSDASLSYRGLNGLANRLGRALRCRGVQSGHLVVIAMERSVNVVAAMLGVWKSGAAYVPVDIALPTERIRQMIDDAAPKVIVTDNYPPEALSRWKDACLSIEDAQIGLEPAGPDLGMPTRADEPAYVMYTSGSTGRPKGVEMSHGSVANYLLSMGRRAPGCSDHDRMLAVTTISFDMAIPELLVPLLCGATTVIARTEEARDAGALRSLMKRHEINVMQGTPATWQLLLDGGWRGEPRLSKVWTAGEALSRRLADRLLAYSDSVWNLYGPTETSYATVGRVYGGDEDVEPGLTKERFVKNPFDGGVMYRTGDRACFVGPNRLRLLGRIDGQVKVRGYRIEPGDIEAAITKHADVDAATVVLRDGRLVAYCICGAGVKRDVGRLLRPWLAEALPAYMMPALFVKVHDFPLTTNGKVDRKALPDPVATGASTPMEAELATGLEAVILVVWRRVLGHDGIQIDDNFFQIGGDSARIIAVQAQLAELLGRPVSTAALFDYFTVRTLAAHLQHNPGEDGSAKASRQSGHDQADLAIVSMACRLPGGVTTPEDFWGLLDRGGDAITDVPVDRWDANALYNADADAPGTSYCRQGGFVDSTDSFDAGFFGMSPREARGLDPLQRIMLETCWEAIERAGYTSHDLRGSKTGVFLGVSHTAADNAGYDSTCLADLDGYAVTGSAGGTLSGRLSYVLGLEGPALTVDTACSSALVALDLACHALRRNECDLAIVGGVSLLSGPGLHVAFSRLRGMSADGRCRAFAADASGTGWGEGAAVVVLKRLPDALHDGDAVDAVVRGAAVNHGGRAAGLTVPSGPAQQRVVHAALEASGLAPADIDYIEAHGTGTKLGDPIEGEALAAVFGPSRAERPEPLWVGSAKSNIGHTQAAAGLVGILKVALAMRHEMIPRTLHVTEPTTAVDWQGARMAPVQVARPWKARVDRPRRAGVSAFGIGGTNAHVVVEEAPASTYHSPARQVPLPHVLPLLVSGRTAAALSQQSDKLLRYLRDAVEARPNDVAFSLATTRDHFRFRKVLMAADKDELLNLLADVPNGPLPPAHPVEPRLAMLFAGQGGQWPGMGRELATQYPVFRQALKEIASHFIPLLERPLLDVMWAAPDDNAAALLQRTDYAQPAIFALEVALWHLWTSWGVRPTVLLGHSIGELGVAHVAGVIDLPDACRLVAARGRLMQAVPLRGGMTSLAANAWEVTTALEALGLSNKVELAGHNTPTQTVTSGDVDSLKRLACHFAGQGRATKALAVSHAFHSHHMDGMLDDLRAVAQTIRYHPLTELAVVSSLTGLMVDAEELRQPEYWVRQARGAVRFCDAVRTLSTEQRINVFLELGPRPVLGTMAAATLGAAGEAPISYMASLAPGKHVVIQESLAALHVRHVPIDWHAYFAPFGCQRVELPTYAFQKDPLGPVRRISLKPVIAGPPPAQLEMKMNWHPVDRPALPHPIHDSGLPTPDSDILSAKENVDEEMVLDMVREAAAEALGLSSPNAVDLDAGLQELGIDSFTAVMMRGKLVHRTGLATSADAIDVLSSVNLRVLGQNLLSLMQKCLAPCSPSTSFPGFGEEALLSRSTPDSTPDVCPTPSALVAVASSFDASHRILCPALGLESSNISPHLLSAALNHFDSQSWCHDIMHDVSPTTGALPGYGRAIAFIPQAFSPGASSNLQFIGNTLAGNRGGTTQPPLPHMLSLFRPSDADHARDPLRPINRVVSLFALGNGTAGHEGILHGGLTATLLDESISILHEINAALAKSGAAFAGANVTASLTVKFLAPIATAEPALCVAVWLEEVQGLYTTVKAELTNSRGQRLAAAESTYAAVEG
ncbi:hypothetical protein RJ55_04347 [Drechmeria coniospora]|nr:hypothetical protein RJ55_04347 [Drechmeria coniospora]